MKNTSKKITNKTNQQKRHHNLIKIIFFIIFLLFVCISPLSAQVNIKVGILSVSNRTNLDYIDTLTSTVEENILFTANQLGRYTIIDGRSEKLTDPTQINRLKRIAKKRRCHFLIAGQVTGYTKTGCLHANNDTLQCTGREDQGNKTISILSPY